MVDTSMGPCYVRSYYEGFIFAKEEHGKYFTEAHVITYVPPKGAGIDLNYQAFPGARTRMLFFLEGGLLGREQIPIYAKACGLTNVHPETVLRSGPEPTHRSKVLEEH